MSGNGDNGPYLFTGSLTELLSMIVSGRPSDSVPEGYRQGYVLEARYGTTDLDGQRRVMTRPSDPFKIDPIIPQESTDEYKVFTSSDELNVFIEQAKATGEIYQYADAESAQGEPLQGMPFIQKVTMKLFEMILPSGDLVVCKGKDVLEEVESGINSVPSMDYYVDSGDWELDFHRRDRVVTLLALKAGVLRYDEVQESLVPNHDDLAGSIRKWRNVFDSSYNIRAARNYLNKREENCDNTLKVEALGFVEFVVNYAYGLGSMQVDVLEKVDQLKELSEDPQIALHYPLVDFKVIFFEGEEEVRFSTVYGSQHSDKKGVSGMTLTSGSLFECILVPMMECIEEEYPELDSKLGELLTILDVTGDTETTLQKLVGVANELRGGELTPSVQPSMFFTEYKR